MNGPVGIKALALEGRFDRLHFLRGIGEADKGERHGYE